MDFYPHTNNQDLPVDDFIITAPCGDSSLYSENNQKAEGGIITPLPMWQHARSRVCSFDGGTRFSMILDRGAGFCHFQRGVLRAMNLHEQTREPVPLDSSGLSVRGASRAELSYFRDLPERGYCVGCEDFRIIIRDSVLDCVSCPSHNDCVVILGWRIFTQVSSLSAAFERVCDVLRELGFVPRLDVINRVDINVTVDDVPMARIREAYVSGLFATRSPGRVFDARPGKLETLYFGKHDSPVMFRVYDKSAELRATVKTEEGRAKLRALSEQFPEESLTHLTRFEWELHRSYLQDFAVRDFRDLETKLSAIVEHLTARWIRVLETRNAADRHRARQRVASWWVSLSESLRAFCVSLTENPVQITRAKHTKTSGGRSAVRSFAWLKTAAIECLSIDREKLDKDGRNATIDALAARLAYALKTSPDVPTVSGWGTGPDLAWNYALQKIEV